MKTKITTEIGSTSLGLSSIESTTDNLTKFSNIHVHSASGCPCACFLKSNAQCSFIRFATFHNVSPGKSKSQMRLFFWIDKYAMVLKKGKIALRIISCSVSRWSTFIDWKHQGTGLGTYSSAVFYHIAYKLLAMKIVNNNFFLLRKG